MPSTNFITKLRDNANNPVLKFTYDGVDKSVYLQSVGEIKRNIDLMPGYVQVTVDNMTGEWDDFLKTHDELTKKAEIIFGLSGFATKTATTIAFHENTPLADTITDSGAGFVMGGFKAGMVINIDNSNGNGNDKDVTIASVTAGTITLISTDDLTDEGVGANVTLLAESLALFTGYVISADYDYDTKSMTLTLRDRLSLALETRLQSITAGEVSPFWQNYYDKDNEKVDPTHVSDLVWNILTLFSKLDGTLSTENTDIDYTSWRAWGVTVDNAGYAIYDIGMIANGPACADVLMKIAQLTNSYMWVGGEGKIKFIKGNAGGQWRHYKEEILGVQWSVSMNGRVNYLSTKWGYHPDDNTWESDHDGVAENLLDHGPLVAPYQYSEEIIEDTVVFHNLDTSAHLYNTTRLDRTAAPIRDFTVTTQLLGFAEDVRNCIALDDLYAAGANNYDDIVLEINSIAFIPETWEARITGQYIWTALELP